MAGSLSNWAESKLIMHSIGKQSWTAPTNLVLALYTSTPTDDSSGVECVGQGYDRLNVFSSANWTVAIEANGGVVANAVEFLFSKAESDWGDIEGCALITVDPIDGLEHVIWYGSFSSPRTVLTGETIAFPQGAFVLSMT